MLRAVVALAAEKGWLNQVIARHADLGRAEWHQTPAHVERTCSEAGVPLVVVRRSDGRDLLSHIEARAAKLAGTGRPFWPSSSQRYCTSDLKRGPLDKHSRQYKLVISAQGLRAEESDARSEKPVLSLNRSITAKPLRDLEPTDALQARAASQRVALVWYPIHSWSTEDVWEAMGTSGVDLIRRQTLYAEGRENEAFDGWPGHPAYVIGNRRLSCSLCVLGSKGDLANGARHNPEYFGALVQLERSTGINFKKNFSLASLGCQTQ